MICAEPPGHGSLGDLDTVGVSQLEPLLRIEIQLTLHYFLSKTPLNPVAAWQEVMKRGKCCLSGVVPALPSPALSSSCRGISLLLDLMVVALHKYPQITFESLYLHHLTAAILLCIS